MEKLFYMGLALLLVGTIHAEEEEGGDQKDSGMGTVVGIDLGTTYSW